VAGLSHYVRLMVSFDKSLQFLEKTLRYSIAATDAGWEVREERNSEIVRKVQYQDWHRVERARRTISIELDSLRQQGWKEIKKSDIKN
jgi:hypothetical protein